jgi:cold shock CspA family protein
MRVQDFAIADAVAQALYGKKTDVNELAKCVGFLRDNPDGLLFFEYLDTVISEGRAVVRSGRTLDYYRAIRDACHQHLTPYKDDPKAMAEILGWAVRLMRYYAVEDKLGRKARPPKAAPRRRAPRPAAAGERRTGFIKPEDGEADIFVHLSQVASGQALLAGQRVSFVMGAGPKGRPQAQHVKLE